MNLPLITSSPHNSDDFADFASRCALSQWQIGEFSDKYTADTAFHPSALGNLKSQVTRGLGSLNQPRDKSLFKLKDFHGNTIWKEGMELTDDEKEMCFQKYYDPYFEEIKRLIRLSKEKGFAKVLLWDHHDTGDFNQSTGKRDRNMPGEERTMPKFILSNLGLAETGEIDAQNGYNSCPSQFIVALKHLIATTFELAPNEVEINTSYKGGHITQYFGDPKNDFGNSIYTIQIEYNRGLVMNQETREPYLDKISKMNEKFNGVMEKACGLL